MGIQFDPTDKSTSSSQEARRNSAVRHATTLPAEANASCARRNSQLDPRYSSYEYESQDEMARRVSTFYGIQFDPTDKSTSSSQEARRNSAVRHATTLPAEAN